MFKMTFTKKAGSQDLFRMTFAKQECGFYVQATGQTVSELITKAAEGLEVLPKKTHWRKNALPKLLSESCRFKRWTKAELAGIVESFCNVMEMYEGMDGVNVTIHRDPKIDSTKA